MDFSSIGLTQNEAKAYEKLLHLGKATAAHISKEAQVSYGRIYDVLASLEEKGLVRVIPEKTKKYSPSDPEQLHEFIISKKKAMEEVEKKVAEFKSVYEQHEEEPIVIAKGKKNFYKILRQMKKATKSSYSLKDNFEQRPEFIREVKGMVKRKVDYKVLGRIDKETKGNVKRWLKITKNIKQIESEGVTMSIIDGEQLMVAMIKSNTIMLIRDKAFIKVMKKLFLNYYKNQPKVNV